MKKKLLTLTLVGTLAITSIALVGCGNEKDSKLDKAKAEITKEIKGIKDSNYLKEEQEKIKKLKEKAKSKIDKAKDEKEVKTIQDDLKLDIAKLPTKKSKIEAFKKELQKSISNLEETEKEKAQKIIDKIDTSKIKSNNDLKKLSKEVTSKIADVTGKKIEEVKTEEIEKKAVATQKEKVKKVSKTVYNSNSTSSKTITSKAKAKPQKRVTSSSSSSKPSSSNTSSSKPKPAKKKVRKLVGYKTVVVKPAWNETKVHHDTKKVTKYTCNGKIFDTYDEGYAYYYSLDGEGTNNDGLYPIQVDVPDNWIETINHKAVTKQEPVYKWVWE